MPDRRRRARTAARTTYFATQAAARSATASLQGRARVPPSRRWWPPASRSGTRTSRTRTSRSSAGPARFEDLRRAGAASLDLAWTAAGVFDGYFELRLGPWDVAAGALLVREAGGVATDWAGDDRAWLDSGNIVVGPPRSTRPSSS